MADGDPVIQGAPGTTGNITQTPTNLSNSSTTANGTGLYLFSGINGDGIYVVSRGTNRDGVRAYSYQGDGVQGYAGIWGTGNAGVRGSGFSANSTGVSGSGEQAGARGEGTIGVIGQSTPEFGIGVEGDASGEGSIGVFGITTGGGGGVGVYATAPSADSAALQVNGRAVFSSSGRLVVLAGATSATQTGLTLNGASLVLALLQEDRPGVAVRAAVPNPGAGFLTVHLTQAPTANTAVAWFVLN
jgi:hypothetical protein